MNYIKRYESFNLKEFKELIDRERTYIKKFVKQPSLLDENKYLSLLNKIKNYDINNFIYIEKPYGIFIYPDENFKEILLELNLTIEPKISIDIDFYVTVDKNNLNQIDFTEGIPTVLRGVGFGYKIYKLIIKNFGYITTNRYSNKLAYNIWYNLMLDDDLYCYTSDFNSGVLIKTISDIKLKNFLDEIRNLSNLIFDDELIEKIIKFYGSLDSYKQN